MDNALAYSRMSQNNFLNQLLTLLKIPSISTDPDHLADMTGAANWVADNMRQIGLENVELMPTAGHPAVYSDWLHAGDPAPTILIYGHYDVQPAVKEDGWTNEPFDPTVIDGKIYARGSSDDKGQMFIHIKAVESILAAEKTLPVNIKFIIEGEEEIGSPNLPALIKANREKLSADVCVISDTGMNDLNQPLIINGLRGLVAMELQVQGPKQDLHSGGYGGAVHNPLQALSEIIAQLHDENGAVTVPGFYNEAIIVDELVHEELSHTAVSDDEWRARTGVSKVWGEKEYTIRERIGARPTLEINGILGGFTGEGIKTVLPAKAMAKVTCRLVPHQDPDHIYELVRDYIAQITPPTVTSSVKMLAGKGAAVLIDVSTPAMQAAISAYEKGWGQTPVFMRGGGTLPIVADLMAELNLPVLLMGYGLTSDGAHGPDESYTISMFYKGIETAIHFFYEVKAVLS